MINKKVIKKWIEALRSGEYKQGKFGLYDKDSDSYCCLGVLCDLRAKALKRTFKQVVQKQYAILPKPVAEWAGLGTNPVLKDDIVTAARLNDMGVSFKKIANLIEKKFIKTEEAKK